VGAISPSRLRGLIDSRKKEEDVIPELKVYVGDSLGIGKFGFVANKEEADSLQKIDIDPRFHRLKELIGDHEALYLVRVGIHIMKLNDEGKRELINKIKGDVKKKHGRRGLNILNLGSTGVVFDVVSYLDTLKLRRKTKDEIIIEFERILDEWEHITIFVTSDHDARTLFQNIQLYMILKHPIFFVFAYGSACYIAMKIIANMKNAGIIIQKNHYLFFHTLKKDKAGEVKMTWRFERTSPSETSEFEF